MTKSHTRPLNAALLWGDFRVFLAGREPTDDQIAAFARKIVSEQREPAYGLPDLGSTQAVIAELTGRLSRED